MKIAIPLTLVLCVLAGVVAGFTTFSSRGPEDPQVHQPAAPAPTIDLDPLENRLRALEDRLDVLELVLAERQALAALPTPELDAKAPAGPNPDSPPAAPDQPDLALTPPLGSEDPTDVDSEAFNEKLQVRVDAAVDKKAAEFIIKLNKKPAFDDFASVLDLTDHQRWAIAHEVVAGQQATREILETPFSDGLNFVDELVEALAGATANPGKNPGAFKVLFGRLTSETYPGTTETYAQRLEAAKNDVRDAFRRELGDEQYAEFEDWKMDPTEIQDIPDSPWNDIEERVAERAKAMGAENPFQD